ncbi:MAG: chemotaxis protein CheW [Deltaproteobacteria bacterium]|nr:chemotaxis protein CheW [Deltaproteobacteria bacterium]
MRKRILDLKQISDAALKADSPPPEKPAEGAGQKAEDEQRLQIISFFLDGEEYAFEVADAVEVLRPRQMTEVPRTPEFIKGILCVRGEMVPVMDLKKRLGIGAADCKRLCRILITSIEDLKAGFLVDRLSGVKDVPVSSIGPALEGERAFKFLKGLIATKEKPIKLLNAAKLIDLTH